MNDVLTLAEVAAYLKLSEKTLQKMVKNQEIPCAKVGSQWRFSKTVIDDWLRAQMRVIPQNDLSRLIEDEYDFVPLSRLFGEDSLIHDLKAGTKLEVFEEMGTLAQGLQLVQNKDEFIRKLMERENMMSTAIGPGIALPHLRNPSPIVINGPRILIGRSKAGVQFDSLDGKPTYLFVMILSDSETVHLRVTAKIAKILRRENLRQQLLSFDYSRQFVEFFIRMEHEFFHPDDLMKPNQ